jgi:uncharacterized protein YhbP (UPF0306 family)
VPIQRSGRRIAVGRVSRLARSLLDASTLCAIATVTPRHRAHVNTAYFAYTNDFEIVWISETSAEHSRNVRSDRTAAIAVFDSHQTWGQSDRGIQLFGGATRPRGRRATLAMEIYAGRFPSYMPSDMSAYVPYVLRTQRMKLFDEAILGEGVLVTCTVGRDGRVAWERTEIYSPTS